jgi:predicted transcriptional regulator
LNVRDVMTADVPSVSSSDSVAGVAQQLLARHLPALPVIDDGKLVGVVLANDLVARHARVHVPFYLGLLGAAIPFQSRREDAEIRHALAVTAGDLMRSEFRHIAPDGSIEDAADILVDDDVSAVMVVDAGTVVGMVTEEDMLRLLLVEEADGSGSAD